MADESAKIKLSEIDFTGLEGELFDRLVQLLGRLALLNTLDLTAGLLSGLLPAANTPITKGTQAAQNPVAQSTVTTQAHGLGRKPDIVTYWLENLTAELGYAIGDRTAPAPGQVTVVWDATNVKILTNAVAVAVNRKDTAAAANITLANWKLVAQPLLFPTAF